MTDIVKAFKAMTSLQKVFIAIAVATVFCSIFTDCMICKRWPLLVDAKWKNPLENFDDGNKLVLYKSSSCPHCIKMMSEWNKVVKDASTLGVAVQTVDAADDPEETQAANVTGFPTIKLYKDGKITEYKGERTATAIESWAKST